MRPLLPVSLALLAAPVLLMAADEVKPAPLTVGSPAPAFKAARWVKGTPVASLEKGKVHVVEFWATWCGPCRMTIPHMTKMAKAFEGKVNFIGMNVWERGETPEKLEAGVDAFVKTMGDRMGYAVARDTADFHMANAWMKAAGQNGIPAAIVVDAEGRVAWIGHPLNGLEKTLQNIVAGKHDLAAAKAQLEKEAAFMAEGTQLQKAFGKDLEAAEKAKDHKQMLALTEQALAKFPGHEEDLFRPRFLALLHVDEAKAKALLDAEKDKFEPDLITPAYVIAGEEGLSKAWYERAIAILVEDLKDPMASPIRNLHLARALAKASRPTEAVAAQEKLLAAARGKAPEARVKQYEADLKLYQEAAGRKPVTASSN
ncbi:MAG: redoxin family protein [Acidobacteria bacterium]|nr:redoxin family protein [Acidobacteriota bacterium]